MRATKRIESAIARIKGLFSLYSIYKKAIYIGQHLEIKRALLSFFFEGNYKEFLRYKTEVVQTGLLNELREKRRWFVENVKGRSYTGSERDFGSGNVDEEAGIFLYGIIRKRKPSILVETGVCAGFSTSFILSAIKRNAKGRLYSIDFPEHEDVTYEKDSFYDQKKGATVPKGKASGWAIPSYLRQNWTLILGKSQDKLPLLLKELKSIDFFLHDSEHSYECMWFEFNEAFSVLTHGGLLLSDDINWNNSFYDFCEVHSRKVIKINQNMGFMVK